MHSGKVPVNVLKKIVISSLDRQPDNLIVGPKVGEDAAVLELGDGYQIVASDPVTGAAKNIGYHAVHVNANDIAATGGDPQYMTVTILLRKGSSEEELKDIMSQINDACKGIGAYVVGGHTEMVPELKINIICGTMFGYAKKYVKTSGARPGDRILLTKGAAIEGTSILAHEYEEVLLNEFGPGIVNKAKLYSKKLSIIPDAKLVRDYSTAMHDPTEGGIAGALNEMAIASECGFDVDVSKIPVSEETSAICSYFSIDPLTLISSGTLLATVPPENIEKVEEIMRASSIEYSFIGEMTKSGNSLPMPDHDALWDVI
ncbi:MAG: AIR synthase family protein [Candidatus Methanofastidiosa archaeon]|nr:AIR synthase family protein [Candidatus Methanofastidiosa archaeon]